MKTPLVFVILVLLVGNASCFRDTTEIPPTTKNGLWPVIHMDEYREDTITHQFSSSSRAYNPGEKAFEFDESNSTYKEYDNGVVTRAGVYIEEVTPKEFLAIFGQDTVNLKIHGQGPWNLVLETREMIGTTKILRTISGNRENR